MKSTLRNMVLVLFLITLIAGVSLGFIYDLTKKPIAESKAAKINEAISRVMPRYTNNPSKDKIVKDVDGRELNVYPAKQDGALIGYAIESFSANGYSGDIIVMVGILVDGTIHDIVVVQQKETPGLGDKMQKTDILTSQFKGKDPSTMQLSVKKDGGEIDAITASTISSRAFIEAVERATEIFNSLK